MKLLLALVLFLSTLTASAVPVSTTEAYLLNRMNPIFRKYSVGSQMNESGSVAIGVYDFTVLGGTVATKTLRGYNGEASVTIPNKAIITNVFVDVITQPVSTGSATVSLGCASTTDLLGATAKASLTVGRQAGAIVAGTVAGYTKATSACTLKAAIAVAALTAGKVVVYVSYRPGL